jgi:MoaA/NifB/PqqE/SkfB family radical SAM enzyme
MLGEAMLFGQYRTPHAEVLRKMTESSEWRNALPPAAKLAQWREAIKPPPVAPGQLGKAADFLKAHNAVRVQDLIRAGVHDESVLLRAIADWHTAIADEPAFPILFLGLVLTLDCSFDPRCLYCNQVGLPRRMHLTDWKRLICESVAPVPPYVYLTGGEPLMLEREVWEEDGLVAFATQRGCAVNVNTNAAHITPAVALQLVRIGLAKLHISLDTADWPTQAELLCGSERVTAVLQGIFNVQIARELLDQNHPQIHINCVMTCRNLMQIPDLVRFLLEIRKVRSERHTGKLTEDPVWRDFAFHLIPVGGEGNAPLRPTSEEWKSFYTAGWDQAEKVWSAYLDQMGVPPNDRKTLAVHVPFANPWLRASHSMNLDEYCERAGRGIYWQGALTQQCYVGPSQAFVLPDGSQHWCGGHAIRRPPPLGNVLDDKPLEGALRRNIIRSLPKLADLPSDVCLGCAGATCVINQAIERSLRKQVGEWLTSARPA